MGGGTSIAVHMNGSMCDASNGLYGGPFSTNRSGAIPCDTLVKLCFSGQFSQKEIMRKLNGQGGLVSYLGESDVRTIERQANAGDARSAEALEAMLYQTCKEIGAMAAVLEGKVDAIILTGGIANSKFVTDRIRRAVSFIGEVVVYPGEAEMDALANGALEALLNLDAIRVL